MRESPYLLADTRIPWVRLYDHLALTAGLSTAMVIELRKRNYSSQTICGISLPDADLRILAGLCGLLHDIGKGYYGKTEYYRHVERGVKYAREILNEDTIPQELRDIILNAIARHHVKDNPETILEKVVCLADSYASAGDRPEVASSVNNINELKRMNKKIFELEEELFGENKPVCLLIGDVDAIKSYIYETTTLPEIRGGSELLKEAEEVIKVLFRETLLEENLIYCGGGSFLAIVPASDAEELKARIKEIYLNKISLPTITVVSSRPIGYIDLGRGLPPYDNTRINALSGKGIAKDLLLSHFGGGTERDKRKNFGELVTYLTGKLQQAKRQKDIVPFIELLPIHRQCESCGKRPATEKDSVRNEWICDICWNKRNKGRSERREYVLDFKEWVSNKKSVDLKVILPENINELAGDEGKIALLYADGNNMGELFQRASSPATYRHISETLNTAVCESLFESIWNVFGTEFSQDPNKKLPFEIITLGGDDIVVLLPASASWAIAVNIIENFLDHPQVKNLQSELTERMKDNISLTLSAGLAIADVKYPIRFLFSLTEGLIKEAKRLAREKQTGTLCHLWLRAPVISENAREILNTLYKRIEQSSIRYLTARPYTVKEARFLAKIACQLDKYLSSTQRRTLAESLEKGLYVSLNYGLYQVSRISDQQTRKQILEIFKKLGSLDENARSEAQRFFFWHQKEDEWYTALLDALELIELNAHKYFAKGVSHECTP